MPLHMHGNNNYFTVTDSSKIQNDETLFHKASNQFGKVFESGTDLIAKLGKLEKKCESEYDETAEAVQELKEGRQTKTTISEINHLKQRQVNQKIKIRVTRLKVEKAADDRDAILAKHFRKFT
ncbi:unnamed protein product [Adineta steineri]|uniref:Uncharacterized protein n=2 Tax=Adineta steineri TaxID=433720 RepID=A0A815RW16_9BILA|nr:unnamed protein product [Adineta steineri]CAF3998121.1 unnamed protein product [Adineta steineri]